MKEASGELSMTLVTIAAIAVIAGIFALLWPKIQDAINKQWGNAEGAVGQVEK